MNSIDHIPEDIWDTLGSHVFIKLDGKETFLAVKRDLTTPAYFNNFMDMLGKAFPWCAFIALQGSAKKDLVLHPKLEAHREAITRYLGFREVATLRQLEKELAEPDLLPISN